MSARAEAVHYEPDPPVVVITLDRPDVANAIDRPTAEALADAFRRFEADESLAVAVLTGANGKFCAGADLKAMQRGRRAAREPRRAGRRRAGRARRACCSSKPVIAAVEGHAVAGGLELAAGATCGSPPRTPSSASTAAAGASR